MSENIWVAASFSGDGNTAVLIGVFSNKELALEKLMGQMSDLDGILEDNGLPDNRYIATFSENGCWLGQVFSVVLDETCNIDL